MSRKTEKQPFWLGGAAASMAATCTHPLDQTKYRMQIMSARQSMFRVLINFATRDGIQSLWGGLSASILRQSTYSTARFGLYNYFAQEMKLRTSQQQLNTFSQITCAGLSGGVAGIIGNPTEVALVRMCADGAKIPKERFAYRNVFDALLRIRREEGLRTFSRGLGPNVVRSIIMNVSQIATLVYSIAKSELLSTPRLGLQDGLPTHFLASLVAGTVATTACAPADVLKSRVQNAVSLGGIKPSVSRIVIDSLRAEGPSFLMKGWTPAWLRLAPNTILTFIFLEQLQRFVNLSRARKEVNRLIPQKV